MNKNKEYYITQEPALKHIQSLLEIQNIIETSSAYVAISTDKILIIIDKPVVKTLKCMDEIIEALEILGNNKKKPCLHDPSQIKGLEKGVRKKLKPHINQKFSHIAILNPSTISNVILAFMLKVDGIKIKHKTFRSAEKAISWIRFTETN